MSRHLQALATLLLALAASWALSLTPFFERVDLWLGDMQQRFVARENSFADSLVVDIDEATLRKLEPIIGVWPYKRDVFALIADYLGEAGAQAVVFDILFAEQRPGDAELAAALTRNPNVVLAASGLNDSQRGTRDGAANLSWPLPAALPTEQWQSMVVPLKEFIEPLGANSSRLGVVAISPDADGSVRRISLFHRIGDLDLPSIAVAALFAGEARPPVSVAPTGGEISVGRFTWPLDALGRVAIAFPKNANSILALPFHELALAAMGGTGTGIDRQWFRGKTIFIGSTALQTDVVYTPRGAMPGAYFLATAHASLAAGQVLKPATGPWAALLLVLALALPISTLGARHRSKRRLVLTALAGAAVAWVVNLALLYFDHRQSDLLFTLIAVALLFAADLTRMIMADARQRHRAEEQMRISAAVFAGSKEAIFIADAGNRIISVNPAFTEITGYTAEEAIGCSPDILSSGRHDADFYAVIWRSIEEHGFWQGEIWNRRKNGEIYPEWLTISIVRDDTGRIRQRIAIFSDISKLKAAQEEIDFLAHFDSLTQLPNRALLHDRVKHTLAAAQRTQTSVALMLFDIDRFKNINDSLGHLIGDRLLEQLAGRLRHLLRDGDTASRQGGDEFILLLPDTDADGAARAARRLLETIAQHFEIDNHELVVTASIGIALFPDNGDSLDALTRCADTALYRAKLAGRANFQFYADEMHARAHEVLVIENALRRVVERGELVLHYQPQVDANSGRLVGLEALVRWRHPSLGLLPPDRFIQIAEESGQIHEIGDWVLATALAQIRAWQDAGLPVVPVAVNLSLAQFRRQSLCDGLVAALNASGIAAGLLELELTESVAMEDMQFTMDSMARMRELGVGLAIDDFGTGYSSLSYLKRFSVSKIKIDKSFVHGLPEDREDEAIVMAIINLAHNLGFRVLAEGVETAAQLDVLRRHGCDEIQGYYYSRPVSADEVEPIIRIHESLRPASP